MQHHQLPYTNRSEIVTFLLIMSSVTERCGTIDTIKGTCQNEVFQAKANFSLRIVAKVEGTKDGYIACITRAPDNVTRYSVC